jgi:hypothetical protein
MQPQGDIVWEPLELFFPGADDVALDRKQYYNKENGFISSTRS